MKTLKFLTASLVLVLPLTTAVSVEASPVLSRIKQTAPHLLRTPRESSDERSTIRLSDEQMRQKIESVPIRRRLTGPAPAPQSYWKVYINDTFTLVCWVNDDSGEVNYCDLYA